MTDPSVSQSVVAEGGEQSGVLRLLVVLAKRRRLVLAPTAIAAIVSVVVSLLLSNTYTARTTIIPPQGGTSQLGIPATSSIGALAGAAGIGGLRSPNELYVGMLKSRTVADSIIGRFGLMDVYRTQLQSMARGRLARDSSIISGRDGIIVVEVEDSDPKRAAEIANAYVDEMFKLTSTLAVTNASQRRLFFERQFEQAKDNLAKAEAAARQVLDKRGVVQIDSQARGQIETTAQLRAQITVKEVQIGSMKSFAADQNPEIQLAQKSLDSMRSELARLEGSGRKGDGIKSDDKASGIESLEVLRNVKYQELLYEMFARQFEAAKIDEAKDSSILQVMDKAIEPDFKSSPKRAQIVLLSTLGGLLLGIILALFSEGIERARLHPEQANHLADLRRYLAWRRKNNL